MVADEEEEEDGEVTAEFKQSICLRASQFMWTGIARYSDLLLVGKTTVRIPVGVVGP
jgi:hypothetical protein